MDQWAIVPKYRTGAEGLGLNWSEFGPPALRSRSPVVTLQTTLLTLRHPPLRTLFTFPARQGPAGKQNLCVLKTKGLSPGLDGYSHVVLWLCGEGELS